MGRLIEDYLKLAEYDYKCLENDSIKNPYCWKDEHAREVLEKLFKIIDKLKQEKCKREIAGKSEREDCSFYEKCNKSKYEMWKAWKQKNGADPDDSSRGNAFARSIYYILWGKRIYAGKEKESGIHEHGWENFTTSYLKFQNSEKLLWGGDTLNTLASYRVQIEMFRCEEGNKERVDIMCRRCHQLGNFVLVPAYFNAWRGFKLQDRMDLAFYVLSEIEDSIDQEKSVDDIFSMKALFYENQKKETDKKWNDVENDFTVWKKKDFNQYINIFFLWDYVEKKEGEEKYAVKNLQYSENEEKKSKYITADTIGTYIDNANTYIKRRSIFMAGMVMIALEFEDTEYTGENKAQWEDWKVSGIYKLIVDKVFLGDTAYSGYGEVIGKIWETIDDKKIKFRDEIKREIKHILKKMCEQMKIKDILQSSKN